MIAKLFLLSYLFSEQIKINVSKKLDDLFEVLNMSNIYVWLMI